MKRTIVLAFIIILICAFAPVGCAKRAGEAEPTPVATEVPIPAALQELLEKTLETNAAMEEMYPGEYIITAEAREGRKLVQTFTFTMQFPFDERIRVLAKGLEDALREQSDLYEKMLSDLREGGIQDPAYIVEYRNKDGSLICAIEFT